MHPSGLFTRVIQTTIGRFTDGLEIDRWDDFFTKSGGRSEAKRSEATSGHVDARARAFETKRDERIG